MQVRSEHAFLHTAMAATVVIFSQSNLECRNLPQEGALYKWLTKSVSDSMHGISLFLLEKTKIEFNSIKSDLTDGAGSVNKF